ncbi:uncharacterized protein LY89DRAFT_735100 [Mollisia scopiformis]|uniref:Uncharacterized protein n=1 Tax=Mollisia scopiformis TaxID=149040 RepID=A0A194X707_MOLSC|nr:uncharacterized protein LY89DRAFT_735100 [Mollisia scopiformis]KUJ15958.1 hypothetical protein LY89DRAFT_735100 [Mollisia scopiformis]
MATVEFENVLDPQYSRYINLREELEAYLTEKYGEGIDFKVFHESDRWSFVTPQKLTKKEVKTLTSDIMTKREKKEKEKQNEASS